jgi:hypothetical protein
MSTVKKIRTLTFIVLSLCGKAALAATEPIDVRILKRVAPERWIDVNAFTISENEGTRYCGNATVPDHAIHVPWLKDVHKPVGRMKGLEDPPRSCRSVLEWDGKNFCLDRLVGRSRLLDLVRRCSEF